KMPGLAITDHGNLYGAVSFYKEAFKKGIKPIIGMEAYIAMDNLHQKPRRQKENYTHVTLLASNEEGYKNLMKLSSIAFLEGFYYRPRIDKELLQKHHSGLIGMSACLQGEISQALLRENYVGAEKAALFYKDLFGDGNFYIELMKLGIKDGEKVIPGLLKLAKDLNISIVATNDVHYLSKDDSEAHDVLLALQTKDELNNENRFRIESREIYFKSPDEMKELFHDIPEAIENTVLLAEKCNVDLQLGSSSIQLPQYSLPEGFETSHDYLEDLARKGMKQRFSKTTPLMEDRLNMELEIIKKMGFCDYCLIIEDLIRFAKTKNIPIGPGRGSAAGSLVLYVLGITNIDPLKFSLIFERFLNPERVSMPDVDIDFSDNKRSEVIDYLFTKYGKDSVAQIITFSKLGAKGVIRDVGRVLGLPYDEADKIAKRVPDGLDVTINQSLEDRQFANLINEKEEYKRLIAIAKRLEGLNRHVSIHASGIVITPGTLTDYVPLYMSRDKEETKVATQYDMKSIEEIGLLKIDILGLRTLTVIENTVESLAEQNTTLDMDKISLDDEATFSLLKKGDTTGVFQLESGGMRDMLKNLAPDKFSDIIAAVALYRPGPMQYIKEFIQKKKGQKKVTYPHPKLETILKDTYGIMIYQEQVMQTASIIANFSLSEADILRRAMGKKMLDAMDAKREAFIKNAKKNHIDTKTAEQIFKMMIAFAGYGFNKSHAAGYAMLAYQTAYLKAHYPIEFFAANLSSVMDNSKKVRFFIEDCKNHNIDILPPSINSSFAKFKPVDGKILFGLAAIKNVGEKAAREIVNEREKNGSYQGLFDFVLRISPDAVNKKAIEGLAKAGAFDCVEKNRARLFATIENALKEMSAFRKERAYGQTGLFDSVLGMNPVNGKLLDVKPWSKIKVLLNENEVLGTYFSGHPYENYQEEIKFFTTNTAKTLESVSDNTEVVCGGIIEEKRKTKDKKGNDMSFLTLADLNGYFDVVVFSSLYKKCWEDLRIGNAIIVKGQKGTNARNADKPSVVASRIVSIDELRDNFIEKIELNLSLQMLNEELIFDINKIVNEHPGDKNFYVMINDCEEKLPLKMDAEVEISKELVDSLTKLTGIDSISIGGKHI
ncbi:MAG: DNA polymerase III subunit alpha, partial [Candidatus Cloacimonadota bacterium]